ncbi:CIC11C00000000325 [Sungouiella intermedia]|uniref:CIC11C00000000325 n=1 Tax=Sungouiella intermedia TaxID=45354 RepID=A0A1L0DQK8_9ASCO|nr:CIC11C00000000325 [[Candida] intermedia]
MDASAQDHLSDKENEAHEDDSHQLPPTNSQFVADHSTNIPQTSHSAQLQTPNQFSGPETADAETVPQIDVESTDVVNDATNDASSVPDEASDAMDQDPNTSMTLHPASSGQQFTTPLKLLPPLKDIEPITTPKSFSVAKDTMTQNVNSSPVEQPRSTQLQNLAEAEEDAFDSVANDTFASTAEPEIRKESASASRAAELHAGATFIGVDPSELVAVGSDVVAKIAYRAQQYQGVLSELSFFKLNQELINQVEQKKFETLLKRVEKLSAANETLTSQNETLSSEVSRKDDLVTSLQNRLSLLNDKLYKLESSTKESDASNNEILRTKDLELFRVNESLNKLTKSNVECEQRLSELTKELNEVTNEKFTYKLNLSKVTNELSYIKNQKDWYEQELKNIQEKYTELIKKHDSTYLQDSNKISSLRSQTETLTSLRDSLQNQVKTLEANLEKERTRASDLESKLEVQTIKYSRESSAKDDLVELLNVQLGERSGRITQLEEYAEELQSSSAESIEALHKDIAGKEEKIIILEERLRRTEEALDSELHKETKLPRLSQSAELIMQTSPLGISLSTLYTEFNHIKKELALERSQKEKLAVQLQHFVSELESKKPAITNYRNQIQFYEQSMKDMLGKLESVRLDKVESEKEANRLRTRLASYETELMSMKQLSKDLGRQLCYYLIHSKIRETNEDPLTSNEKRVIDLILSRSGNRDGVIETDTDKLISERLVNFASVIEMQHKNEELLLSVRLLGKQLEEREHETNGFEAAAVEEAREAILTLQGELDSVTLKLSAVTKERDLLKSLNGNETGADASGADLSILNSSNKELKARITETEKAMRELQSQTAKKIGKVNEKLTEANNTKEELQLKLSSVKHSVELSESRLENSKKLLENVRADLDYFRKEATFWKEQASKQESLLVKKSNELRDAEKNLIDAASATKNLATEKEVWTSLHLTLKDEILHLKKDKEHLNTFVFNLQSLIKERESASLDLSNKLSESVQNYQALQQKISEKEERILILANQSELALKAQNVKLEQVNELSQKLLDAKSKLAEKQSLIDSLRRKLTESVPADHRPRQSSTILHADNDATILPSEYEDIKNDLKIAESQVTEFSNIAKAAEDALMKATESFDKFKVSSDEKIHDLISERDDLTSEVTTYKKNVEDLQSQLYSTENKYMNEVQELKSKVHEFSLKASSYDTLQSDFETKIATINSDLQSQININTELDGNYKSKLKEIEQLTAQITDEKRINDDLRSKVHDVTSKLQNVDAELKAKEEIISEQQAGSQEELAAAKMKIKDLEYQYNLALNQIELNTGGAPSVDSEGSDDLKQVVLYLRREKDNAEAKVISLVDEQSRLKSQLNNLTSELNASRSQVSRMQTMKLQLDDATKDHERLKEQLEQLNILRESNTTLRNENKVTLEQVTKLRAEIEKLKNQAPVTVNADDTEVAVQLQELQLLKEENERLKTQLTNNDEVKNLLQRFENLKNEFKTKLTGHRNKNKELEKQLNETKTSLEEAQKLATSNASQKANEDKNLAEEINRLKATFATEKQALTDTLKKQYDESLHKELEAAKANNSSTSLDAMKKQVESEWRSKLEASKKEIAAKYAKELDSKVQQKVNEKLALAPDKSNIEKVKKSLTEEYEKKIKNLKEEFDKRLAQEVKTAESAVDKKYEFKLRVLNRKVERLEKDKQPQVKPNAGGNSNTTNATTTGNTNANANSSVKANANANVNANIKNSGIGTGSAPSGSGNLPTFASNLSNTGSPGPTNPSFGTGGITNGTNKRPLDATQTTSSQPDTKKAKE